MSKDKNFDQHKERFRKNIYDTPKGVIRLKIIDKVFNEELSEYLSTPKNILDAGCGMGQVSASLAKQGHTLTLCDHSLEMVNIASDHFQQNKLNARFFHSDIQSFCNTQDDQYDLIICHAVLEWLEEPELLFEKLARRLRPGGYLSLMFYNVNAVILFNLLKGNFRKVVKQDFKGHPGGLTPTNPIDPEKAEQWLEQSNFSIKKRTGVRVLYDYLTRDLKNSRSMEDILEIEFAYCNKSPFNMMGRYLHYLCQYKG